MSEAADPRRWVLNPWDCAGSERQLWSAEAQRTARARGETLIATITDLLERWPGDSDVRLQTIDARLRMLFNTLAGYPELAPRSRLPFEEPFRATSDRALELTLELDSWPALAGGHGLRAELLWLDAIRRSHPPVCPLLATVDWLALVLGWLLAGLAAPTRSGPRTDLLLLDVLYDPRARAIQQPIVDEVASWLVAAARAPLSSAADGWFVALGASAAAQAAQALWTARLARRTPLQNDGTLDVQFHHIQPWLFEDEEADDLGAAPRGASDLLETVLSAVRRTLLHELGPGRLLIDGGGRLRFLCPPARRTLVETAVRDTIEQLLLPTGVLGRRFPGFLHSLATEGALGALPVSEPERSAHLDVGFRQLAWKLVPPMSVRFMSAAAPDVPSARLSFRRRWAAPRFSEPHTRGGRAPLTTRLRTEIGVAGPLERQTRLRLQTGGAQHSYGALPSGLDTLRQILVADVNKLGWLFSSARYHRQEAFAESVARRSLRFTAHWLRAVTHAARQSRFALEVLLLGGDDLVVGTRTDDGDLSIFAFELHAALAALNDELPPCQGVSFSAGLATLPPSAAPVPARLLLAGARRLEQVAKRHWQHRVIAAPAPPVGSFEPTIVGGAEQRMSLLVSATAALAISGLGEDPLPAVVALDRRPEDWTELTRLLGIDADASAPHRSGVVTHEVDSDRVHAELFAPKPDDAPPSAWNGRCTCAEARTRAT
ncbi:MAG TPA: hypothetical protein VHT71_00410 [Methylomirabilota bacterium]|jgi:hypothetical protein|nr:hypothetical protein [Methylomirabilota bacterium]